MPDEKKLGADEAQVKVNFRILPRMPSVYAHHLLIQPGSNEVTLSFFEVIPPIFTDQPTEERLKLVQETGITAECVARITIAKDTFAGFAKAMQQVVEQITAQETQDANNTRDNPKS